ncbi:MAG: ketol-acid reductoisomerase [Aigarchaeota archaeon]|nr:ketol-acid reductoisomerase [Aigarchaeota archaeon]MCX8193617.1 ketol-acid reductoisomerase [Nitrososphaeria archaeon]MDW7987017.1 ketol-acid reductoisomerase [Nitrososphaerota archaeon]
MVKIWRDKDIDMNIIKDMTIAVIGYGSQGRAQALNMKDSGLNVVVGVRQGGESWKKALNDGMKTVSIKDAVVEADIIHILIPDTEQPKIYKEIIEPHLSSRKTVSFSHGYNFHFKLIDPPKDVDVIMVAPKGPGPLLREMYLKGDGVPSLVAVGRDFSGKALEKALAMAKAIGSARRGVIQTTFQEETETDLLGEQAVLVGGVMELIKKGFEVLIENGYQPEVAYFEVCNELKLIVDLIYRDGLIGMLKAVSDTAKYGGLVVGPEIVDQHVKDNMVKALKAIKDGSFEKIWTGNPRAREILEEKMKHIAEHPIEKVGREVRALFEK